MPIIAASLVTFCLWALGLAPDEMPEWFPIVLPIVFIVGMGAAGKSIHDYAARRAQLDDDEHRDNFVG